MTVTLLVPPVYRLTCDHPGCRSYHQADDERAARIWAKEDGWQVRPFAGKGSRTAPDLCPDHKTSEMPR